MMKPKKKQGLRSSGSFVNEKNIEQNVRNEIAKEIKPKTK